MTIILIGLLSPEKSLLGDGSVFYDTTIAIAGIVTRGNSVVTESFLHPEIRYAALMIIIRYLPPNMENAFAGRRL
jgi:hypothetical protein